MANDLLTACTPEGYEAARKSLHSFIHSNSLQESLQHWLTWWHERRHVIFRAFTGYAKPRANQAEVIHAGWIHRDRMGVSLLDSCLFDIRDNLVFESQLGKFEQGSYSGGCGPSQCEREKRSHERDLESANQFGKDIVEFGLRSPTYTVEQRHVIGDLDGYDPPKKKRTDNNGKMFEKRKQNADEDAKSLKVRKVSAVNATKRMYTIASSSSGKTNYVVVICNTPSCTCPDNQRNGKKVFCKHIIFVLNSVMEANESVFINGVSIADDSLKELFEKAPKKVPDVFLQPSNFKVQTQSVEDILQSHPLFGQTQLVTVIKKIQRSAKCRSCKKKLEIGELCLQIEGALNVPYGQSSAVGERIYSCPRKVCITKMPRWTNVRGVSYLNFEDGISFSEKEVILSSFSLQQ